MASRRRRRRLVAAAAHPLPLPLLLLLVLPLLLAPACYFPTRVVLSRAEEPSATVREISANSFDDKHADLTLHLELQNPGSELSLASADYELLAQGRSFALGTVTLRTTVPAGGRASVSLPLQLAYLGLPYAARNLFRAGQRVQLVARGTLRGGSAALPAAIPFDGEAEVGLTFGPDAP